MKRHAKGHSRRLPGWPAALLLALAVMLGGLLGGLPVRRADAAFPAIVRVTITEVENISVSDGVCGDADFYAVAHLNGEPDPGQESPEIGGDDHPFPLDWVFTANFSYGTVTSIPIQIDLFDDDEFPCLTNDHADISPVDGSTLHLTVNLSDVPCTVSGPVGGNCNDTITSEGLADDDVPDDDDDDDGNAKITFRVEVIHNLADSDQDGIPDQWEQNGVTFNGHFINLKDMGADKNKPDIFIHLDWMADPPDTTKPRNEIIPVAALDRVVTAFATAPTPINLHIDQGPNSTHMGTVKPEAKPINWAPTLGAYNTTNGSYNWDEFQGFKDRAGGFTSLGRGPVFHYAIAASAGSIAPAGGKSRGTPGSDFIVAQGAAAGTTADVRLATTLMHELGHNLGLQHGGGDAGGYKPNYISVMNYLFPFGLDSQFTIDYSRKAMPNLDETKLVEKGGLGPAAAGLSTAQLCPPTTAGTQNIAPIAQADQDIDWDCDINRAGTYAYDLNRDGACIYAGATGMLETTAAATDTLDAVSQTILAGPDETCETSPQPGDVPAKILKSYNDWALITLKNPVLGALGDANLPLITLGEPEPPVTPPTTTAQVAPAPTGFGWNKTPAVVTLTAARGLGFNAVKDITYSAAGAQPLASTTVNGASASITLASEGVTTVTFHARDAAGNVEADRTLTVRIDTTLPTISGDFAPKPNAAGWVHQDVTVTFTCADPGQVQSGLASCTSPVTVATEGIKQDVKGEARDRADNAADARVDLPKIDNTKPFITCGVAPSIIGPADGRMVPVRATVGVSDDLSGSAGFVLVSIEPNQAIQPNDVQDFRLQTPDTEGLLRAKVSAGTARIYTLTYRGLDVAGNTADCQTTVTVQQDATPPVVACSVTPAAIREEAGRLMTITATVTVTDGESGPDGFILDSISGNVALPPGSVQGFALGTPDTTGQLLASPSGVVYTLRYKGFDKVGNTAFCSATVRVASVGTFAVSPAAATVQVGEPTSPAFTWTVPAPDNWHALATLELRLRDEAGEALRQLRLEAGNEFRFYDDSSGKYGPGFAPWAA